MILEFSIANFLSFKDKVTFSMIANATSGLDENYIISNGRKILKTAAIYGANASGKTNLFRILALVMSMLRNSNNISINSKLPIYPFKFDKNTINMPSEFEIKFVVDDVRYVYGFVVDKNDDNIKDKLYNWYGSIDWSVFYESCHKFIEEVVEENIQFNSMINNFYKE